MARKPKEGGALSSLSTAVLQRELRKRSRKVVGVIRKRDRLLAKVDRLNATIRSMGGEASARGGRRRPQNEMSLPQSLAKVLSGKTMGVTEVAEAVQRAGYKTSAENFRTIVNQALLKHRKLFKKISRGQYTAT